MTATKYPKPIDYRNVEVGDVVNFYCEVQQEYLPATKRLRRFTGQEVTVIEAFGPPDPDYPEEGSTLFKVRTGDGTEFHAHQEELNGWDLDLGQFFWPDGTYGPDHCRRFMRNERD